MKKKIGRILSYVLVAVAACALTLVITAPSAGMRKLQQLEALMQLQYVDGVDTDELADVAASAMVDALGDRWSYYISAQEYAAYEEQKNNAYVGVGISVQWQEEGYLVLKVEEGGPAKEAGILAGDRIVAVDGQSLAGMTSEESKGMIQGEAGTKVELTVLREDQQLTFTVERRVVQSKVATGRMLQGNVGLVTIKNFNSKCFEESKAAIETLIDQGATALIFDVRNNGGGYKSELVKLLDYLLPEGILFRSLDGKGNETRDMSDASCLDIPMAVLVNGDSYSAAEFFAAALEEYDAAVVVGQQTSGKGYFQVTFRLLDGSAVALSTGKYCTPNGISLEGVGITPEVYVDVDNATANAIYAGTLDPMEDPQILAAIAAVQP